MADAVEKVMNECEQCRKQRGLWDYRFQECADYFAPEIADFTIKRAPGQKRGEKIFNSVGMWANDEFAARVDSFLTGSGTTWLGLVVDNDRLDQDREVRGWLQQCLAIAFTVWQSPKSGFDISKAQGYEQLGSVGTAPIFIGEDRNGLPYYRTEFLGNVSFWCDNMGEIQTVARYYKDSAWSLAKEFGAEALPDSIRTALDNDPQKQFEILHGVLPWDDARDGFNMARHEYVEYYISLEGRALIRKRGFWEQPWVIARWKLAPREIYGRSPGMRALSDVLQLQLMERSGAKVVHHHADPGWRAQDDGSIQPRINSSPGGVSYGNMNAQGHWTIEQNRPYGDPESIAKWIGRLEERIKKHFYLDAFKLFEKLSPEGSVVHASATEVSLRQSEQLRLAGPLLVNLRLQWLYPLVERTFKILGRNGKLPMPPYKLRGQHIHPEYRSPMATAQQTPQRQAILQTVGDIMPLMQIDPTASDAFNIKRLTDELGRLNQAPVRIFNSDSEIDAIRKARADAQAQGVQSENVKNLADAGLSSARATQALRGA